MEFFPPTLYYGFNQLMLRLFVFCRVNDMEQTYHLGGISSSVLSVFFTDNCYKLLKSLHLIGWEQICQWKTLTKRLMKCPPDQFIYDFMKWVWQFLLDCVSIKLNLEGFVKYEHDTNVLIICAVTGFHVRINENYFIFGSISPCSL